MKRSIAVGAAVMTAVSVVLTLAGCENFGLGPMSIQRSGTHVVFAVCADVEVDSVSGDYATTAQSKDFVTFLDERGDSLVRFGATWSTANGLPGLRSTVLDDPPIKAGTSLDVLVSASNEDDGFESVFTVPSAGLSSTKWLHPDGRQTTSPCTGVVS